MTSSVVEQQARPRLLGTPTFRDRQRESLVLPSIAITLAGNGLVLIVAALVDLGDGADESLALAGTGLVAVVVAVLGLLGFRLPPVTPRRAVLPAIVSAWLTMFGVAAVAYIVTGTVDRFDDALFEAVSGYTTTGLTMLEPETLGHGLLFWRSMTQWLGGIAALMVAVAVVPYFGAERDHVDGLGVVSGAQRLVPHLERGVRNLMVLYLAATSMVVAAYVLAGMGLFDGVTYALTTVSTGGFANHSDSFAHFDSAAIEWVGTFAMLGAGANIAVLWWALQGAARPFTRSVELRVYFGLIGVSTALITAWTWQDSGGGHDTVRHGAFSVVSLTTTTGHRVVDWTEWTHAAQGLVLVLIGIGSMAGAVGGGFRILRAMELVQYVRRELRLRLQPRAVIAVKVSRRPISEDTLAGVAGYQLLYLGVGGLGAFGLAAFGSDLLTAVSAAVAALGTVGPGLGELGPFSSVAAVDRGGRGVLMALMFAGRLSIYPLLITAGVAATWARRALRR